MKTRTLLFLFLLTLTGIPSVGRAQIVITSSSVGTQLGGRTAATSFVAIRLDGLQAVADVTGGDRTFDLRSAAFLQDDAFSHEASIITCSDDLPGCQDPDLNAANLIALETYGRTGTDSVALSFMDLTDDGFFVRGGASRGDFDDTSAGLEEVSFTFKPALQIMKFPLTMGTNWVSATELSSSDLPGFAFEMEESYVVESWGRLVTPHGEMEALKLRNETITRFEVEGIELADTSYTIQFVTKGVFSASIELDGEGTVIGAGYTIDSGTGQPTEPGAEVPTRVALAQNYPNPFNPSTTITFDLPQATSVRLAVYDVLGREVAVLVDGVRPAGSNAVPYQADALPGGVYLYRLEAGAESHIRQMVLLK